MILSNSYSALCSYNFSNTQYILKKLAKEKAAVSAQNGEEHFKSQNTPKSFSSNWNIPELQILLTQNTIKYTKYLLTKQNVG